MGEENKVQIIDLVEAAPWPRLASSMEALGVDRMWLRGNAELLNGPLTGFLCSIRCPGSVILATHDYFKSPPADFGTVVSGFHSPLEKEVLRLLLRRKHPVVWCPARGLGSMRINPVMREAMDAGSVLIISSFGPLVKRVDTNKAAARNRFVAGLSDRLIIPHAAPGSVLAMAQSQNDWPPTPVIPIPSTIAPHQAC